MVGHFTLSHRGTRTTDTDSFDKDVDWVNGNLHYNTPYKIGGYTGNYEYEGVRGENVYFSRTGGTGTVILKLGGPRPLCLRVIFSY